MKRRNLLKYGIEAGVVTLLGVGIVESDLLSNTDTLPIRPPGAPAESDFLRRCIKCGRCIQTCPVDALGFTDIREGVLRSGTPKLVPEAAGCITWDRECLACIDACPVDALEPVATDENGIPTDEVIGRAQIDDTRCINCGNCYPICPVDAVYPEGREGRPTYSIDYEACIGCGRCIEICPVEDKAVELYPPDSEPEYPIEMDGKA